MRVKALLDKFVTKEGVVSRVRKSNKNLLDSQVQYKEALRTLNSELKELKKVVGGRLSKGDAIGRAVDLAREDGEG